MKAIKKNSRLIKQNFISNLKRFAVDFTVR